MRNIKNKYFLGVKFKVLNGTTGGIQSYHYALNSHEPNTYTSRCYLIKKR
jgi:hypothetical protein